jgi:hypothetical protein
MRDELRQFPQILGCGGQLPHRSEACSDHGRRGDDNIRQAEVGAAKTMLDRTAEQFDVTPSRLVADGGYGSAEMVGWLVDERGIEPHVNLIDKAERTDGTFSREPTSHSIEKGTSMSAPAAKSSRNTTALSPSLARGDERRDDDLLCA